LLKNKKMLNHLKYFALFLLLPGLLGRCTKSPDTVAPAPSVPDISVKERLFGADMSFLPEVRASGLPFFNLQGQQEDMLLTLRNAGAQLVRLRLWYQPAAPASGMASVKNLCDEIRAMGMKTLVTMHYSDTWADPGQQQKPAAWQGIPQTALADSVYTYTQRVVTILRPDYLQIGNEINDGLLWPEGRLSSNPAGMNNLLAAGIRGAREADSSVQLVLHFAGMTGASSFFAGVQGLDYDIIALSYYPQWHGKDLSVLESTLRGLAAAYQKPVLLAETAYPFTLAWDDWTNNVLGLSSQLLPAYPATPKGQAEYLRKIKALINAIPAGLGFCYWGAEWTSYKGNMATDGSTWENQAFWDFDGRGLEVLEVFGE
jgi:arabinogalactan endo-1,4-beta-galactosidase